MSQENLFAALRAAFPANLDEVAVETDHGLKYSWRDLDRASAMLANLLDGLKLIQSFFWCIWLFLLCRDTRTSYARIQ